ncbi:response regulator transcription factor [Fluoribacter gormanii]|uniref:Transcriptional regulatory protein fixJ n=1 Tax=Fluoribacter gormanii TaxID=464 RepID=A0A377GM70_9GAMM|nr:response regulator [Fluoribacter gormanii]KTD01817.1 sigma 54-dependent response regulator [Fluoribacter gormanii]MCW8442986.1 response regulator [Fluoribacter gormanii]SIR21708.1 two component transcriptional regulator, LuxR family [Fluoribacter gormanii]STO25412.1 Transcriptional regulatory protein fixJ [Fluoribacter gormanii]
MDFANAAVFVVDDDPEICQSFRWLFESVNIPVHTYDNAKSFLDSYDNMQKGCLIIDVRMPLMSGLELLEHLNVSRNPLSIIMITGYGDIPMAVRAMKAGATDFILKPVNHQHLLEITQKCLKKTHSHSFQPQSDFYERLERLTKRERQVMNLVIEGKLNKQIAHMLDISISTVEVHRANVMRKMATKTLAELIKINLLHTLAAESASSLVETL